MKKEEVLCQNCLENKLKLIAHTLGISNALAIIIAYNNNNIILIITGLLGVYFCSDIIKKAKQRQDKNK